MYGILLAGVIGLNHLRHTLVFFIIQPLKPSHIMLGNCSHIFFYRYIMVYPSRHHQPSHGTICEREAVLPDWFGRNMRKLTPTAQPGWRQSHGVPRKTSELGGAKKVTFVQASKKVRPGYFCVNIFYTSLYQLISYYQRTFRSPSPPFENVAAKRLP